jgi:hypothetical protein
LTLRVCEVFNVFEVGNRVQIFNCIFVSIEFTTLSRLYMVWCAANSQILLLCNLKIFRMG